MTVSSQPDDIFALKEEQQTAEKAFSVEKMPLLYSRLALARVLLSNLSTQLTAGELCTSNGAPCTNKKPQAVANWQQKKNVIGSR